MTNIIRLPTLSTECRRVKLSFTEELIQKPIIHEVSRRFPIVTNIRRASVELDHGWVILDISGTSNSLEGALAWMSSEGVSVQLMHTLNVSNNEEPKSPIPLKMNKTIFGWIGPDNCH